MLQTPTRKRPQATTTQAKRRNQPHSTLAVGEPPADGAELDLLADDRLKSYLPAVLGATALVAVLPTVVVWYLRESGAVSSYLLGAAIGVVLSLSLAQAGRLVWQKGKHSKQLLFSELLLWGYLERRYRERRLRNARALLGHTNDAQQRIEGGLSKERQVKLLEQMAATLDSRDPCTHGHSRRVARFAWTIASRMGLPREEVDRIRTAAAVHDLGKIETPNSILRKPGKLTDEEYEIMKRHAADGARMVEVLNDVELTAMVRHHHERLDGSGYPDKLRGEDIPLGARIIAVADTFDSITADRPYRAARPHKEALDILTKEAGTKLDGQVVSVFQRHYAGRRRLAFFSSLSTLPERVLEQLASAGGGVATAAKAVAVAALLGNVAAGTAKIAATPASQVSKSSGGQVTTASGVAPSGASSSSSGAQGQVQGRTGRSGGRRNNARGARRAVGAKGGVPGAIAAGTTGGGSPSAGSGSANANTSAGAGQGSGSSETTSSSGQESKPTASTEAGKEQGSKTTTSGSSSAPSTGTATGSGNGNGKSNGGGAVGGVVETVKETKGKVEETVKETVKGTVDETKKTVETVKGTVEETKGKVEETTKGVVEETKKKLKEIIKLAQPRLAG